MSLNLKGKMTNYPDIKIGKQFYSSNTFGFSNSKYKEITNADVKIINGFSVIAKDSCRGYYAYAISNISSSYVPFKNNSTLVYVSANTICISKIK